MCKKTRRLLISMKVMTVVKRVIGGISKSTNMLYIQSFTRDLKKSFTRLKPWKKKTWRKQCDTTHFKKLFLWEELEIIRILCDGEHKNYTDIRSSQKTHDDHFLLYNL